MKQLTKPFVSAAVFAFSGVVAMALRFWFLSAGVDDRGLLVNSHLGCILPCILCIGLPILLWWKAENRPLDFSATPLSAAGAFALAIGFGVAAWKMISSTTLALHLITGIFGAITAVCALAAGISMIRGVPAKPLLLCPGILFFMGFLFCRYQQWSGETEMQRYLFQLLSAVFSMFSLYRRVALSVKMTTGKKYLFCSRTAILMCLAAVPGSQIPVLWLALAAFFALDGCEESAA